MDRLLSEDVLSEIIQAFVVSGIVPSTAAVHQLSEASGKSEGWISNQMSKVASGGRM